MLKIQYDDSDYEHIAGLNALNWSCIKASTSVSLNPSEAKVPCKHYGNQAQFRLVENYVQDVYSYYGKEWVVNEKRNIGNTLKLDRMISNDYNMHVGPPRIGNTGFDFNTLWRMDFTMGPSKEVRNQMWFV